MAPRGGCRPRLVSPFLHWRLSYSITRGIGLESSTGEEQGKSTRELAARRPESGIRPAKVFFALVFLLVSLAYSACTLYSRCSVQVHQEELAFGRRRCVSQEYMQVQESLFSTFVSWLLPPSPHEECHVFLHQSVHRYCLPPRWANDESLQPPMSPLQHPEAFSRMASSFSRRTSR